VGISSVCSLQALIHKAAAILDYFFFFWGCLLKSKNEAAIILVAELATDDDDDANSSISLKKFQNLCLRFMFKSFERYYYVIITQYNFLLAHNIFVHTLSVITSSTVL
jgi:hypothetical protein